MVNPVEAKAKFSYILLKIKYTLIVMLFVFFMMFIMGLVLTFTADDIDSCHLPYTASENQTLVSVPAVRDSTVPQWTASNINIEKDQPLELEMSGSVEMCLGTTNGTNRTIIYESFPPIDHKWQPTGVYVVEGLPFSINVTGMYSQFSELADPKCMDDLNPNYSIYQDEDLKQVFDVNQGTRLANTGRWNDTNSSSYPCFSNSGKGLFIHIGEPDGGLESTDFGDPHFQGKGDRFFEFFEYNNSGPLSDVFNPHSGYLVLNNAPASGQIYIRYGEIDPSAADTTTAPWQWQTSTSASDNQGQYNIKINSKCTATAGRNLVGFIGNVAPDQPSSDGTFLNLSAVTEYSQGTKSYFKGDAPESGKLFFSIIDVEESNSHPATGDGNYTNNSGSYYINVSYGEKTRNNTLLNALIDPVKILLHGTKNPITYTVSNDGLEDEEVAEGEEAPPDTIVLEKVGVPEAMFKAISANGKLNIALQACMALAIALYAFKYVATGAGGNLQELIIFTVRLSIIIALISPESWDFFYNYLFQGVMGAVDQISSMYLAAINPNSLVNSVGGVVDATRQIYGEKNVSASDVSNVFGFLGIIIDFITDLATWPRVVSLLTHSIFGIFLFFVIIISIILFFMTVYRCLLTYLTSMIFLALLLGIAPIFIGFILFNYTRKFAHNWFRAIIFYILNPIMLLCLVGLFATIFFSFLYNALDFGACYECVIEVGIPGIGGHLCLMANFKSWVTANLLQDSTRDAIMALCLYIVATAMYKLPDLSYAFAYRLAGIVLPDTATGGSNGDNKTMGGQMGITNAAAPKTAARAASAASPAISRAMGKGGNDKKK